MIQVKSCKRLAQNFSIFSNTKRELIREKLQYFAPAYLGSVTCSAGYDDQIKHSIIYQVKCLRKALKKEVKATKDLKIRVLDILLKLLLPASFIVLKITGSYIDFMLALGLVKFLSGVPWYVTWTK